MSGAGPHRRRVLAAGATLFLAGPAVLAGCILPVRAPRGPDPLEAPARHAEADAALAREIAQLATPTDPALTAAARALAEDRMAHAAALRTELRRVRPQHPAPRTPAPATPPSTPADLTNAHSALTQATQAAQHEAATLTMTLPGYRAALLASVSACCATHSVHPALPDMAPYRGERTRVWPEMAPYRGGVAGLQGALAREHAAMWVYGVAGAFVGGGVGRQLGVAAAGHQVRRDATERMLIEAGAQPVPPEPGYLTPEPVTDAASALRLVITAETDVAAGWRSVIERSTADPDLRGVALAALTAAAVHATQWRAALGGTVLTVPFPGAP